MTHSSSFHVYSFMCSDTQTDIQFHPDSLVSVKFQAKLIGAREDIRFRFLSVFSIQVCIGTSTKERLVSLSSYEGRGEGRGRSGCKLYPLIQRHRTPLGAVSARETQLTSICGWRAIETVLIFIILSPCREIQRRD